MRRRAAPARLAVPPVVPGAAVWGQVFARYGSESCAGVYQEKSLVAAFHASLDQQEMVDADGWDGGVRWIAGRIVEGSQLQDACPGIHADSEALKDIGAQDAIRAGGEAVPGDFDEALFESEIAEGHGACQGDVRFSRAGFAETTQAGGGDGFQTQVPGGAGVDRDAARAGIQQQPERLATVDPRRDQYAGLRGGGGTESGERQPVGGIRAGEPRGRRPCSRS